MDLNRIDAAFKSDDIDEVKFAFKLVLLTYAADKITDAAYNHANCECDIDDQHEVLPMVAEAWRIYDFFGYPEESIKSFIQESWDEFAGISDEDLEKLWEAL